MVEKTKSDNSIKVMNTNNTIAAAKKTNAPRFDYLNFKDDEDDSYIDS